MLELGWPHSTGLGEVNHLVFPFLPLWTQQVFPGDRRSDVEGQVAMKAPRVNHLIQGQEGGQETFQDEITFTQRPTQCEELVRQAEKGNAC